MQTVGERIKLVRNFRKLNQLDFAESIGISQTHVSKIENGTENPSKTLLMFISHRYNIDYEWLKNGVGEMYPTYDNETEGCLTAIKNFSYELEVLVKHLGQHDSRTVMYCLNNFRIAMLGPLLTYCVENDIDLQNSFSSKNNAYNFYSTYLDTLEDFSNDFRYITSSVSKLLLDKDDITFKDFNKDNELYKNKISKSINNMMIENYENKQKNS